MLILKSSVTDIQLSILGATIRVIVREPDLYIKIVSIHPYIWSRQFYLTSLYV